MFFHRSSPVNDGVTCATGVMMIGKHASVCRYGKDCAFALRSVFYRCRAYDGQTCYTTTGSGGFGGDLHSFLRDRVQQRFAEQIFQSLAISLAVKRATFVRCCAHFQGECCCRWQRVAVLCEWPQTLGQLFCEIDLAVSEGLDGMTVDSIKPQGDLPDIHRVTA